MAPMECPRCVAEGWARRARLAANAGFTVMVVLASTPCVLPLGLHMTAEWQRYDPNSVWGWLTHHELDCVYWSLCLALAAGCISLALASGSNRFGRHAATPLMAPAVDPLATYREGGPLECPRHPFAR